MVPGRRLVRGAAAAYGTGARNPRPRREPAGRSRDRVRAGTPGDRLPGCATKPTAEAAGGSRLADPLHDRVDDRVALAEVRVRIHRRLDLFPRQDFRHLRFGEQRIAEMDSFPPRLLGGVADKLVGVLPAESL